MCYDIRYLTKRQQDYAKRFGEIGTDLSILTELDTGIKTADLNPVYHTNGFQHRNVPVITNRNPEKISFFSWGLIPFWVKDSRSAVQLSNKTLNARGEEVTSKPSFRAAAKSKRCLVMIDGFFEHHHAKGSTFPYHIELENEEPFALAGLWERWEDKENDSITHSFSIVTTRGNELLTKIHNNPKLKGPRMPVIIPKEYDELWLKEDQLEDEEWNKILTPFPSGKLKSITVRKLRGKEYIGNKPEIIQAFSYPELNTLFG